MRQRENNIGWLQALVLVMWGYVVGQYDVGERVMAWWSGG